MGWSAYFPVLNLRSAKLDSTLFGAAPAKMELPGAFGKNDLG